tara:strand:+ start:88 stop:714 length:627 start_codon:yes stop_codon:yes gene_type:complete
MTGNVYLLDKYKCIYFIIFSILIVYGKMIWADTMIIDDMRNTNEHGKAEKADFCEDSSERWCFVTDKVMGGVSEGRFETKVDGKDSHYNMQGNVSTANNGGFLQFRTKISNHPAGKLYKGVRIQVRGNNEEYAVHIRTKYLFLPWQYYQSKFIATKDWQVIELPLKGFKKSNFYQPSTVSSIDIQTLGIVAIGRDFQADIDLRYIELY